MATKEYPPTQQQSLLCAPTPERQQHNGGFLNEKANPSGKTSLNRYRARFECLLDAYYWHGRINHTAFQAGIKFRRDYQRAILHLNKSDYGSGSHGDVEMPFLSVIHSNDIIRKACAALSTAQRQVVINVCVYDQRVGRTSTLTTLRRALNLLAKHWQIA